MPAAPPMSLRFLGTSSMPNFQRNYSSLLVKLATETIMVDCGEGTQQRLMRFNPSGRGRLASIRTILITHLHMDHVLGLVPMLSSMVNKGGGGASPESASQPQVTIYGPLGLRSLIRTQLHLCYANLDFHYAVHELIWPSQQRPDGNDVSEATMWNEPTDPMQGAVQPAQRSLPMLPRPETELPGRDIVMDKHTCTWPSITTVAGGVRISAAPILHRCPTLAYVIEEPTAASPLSQEDRRRLDDNAAGLLSRDGIRHPRSLTNRIVKDRQPVDLPDGTTLEPPPLTIPGRKLAICGDTYDATGGLDGGGGAASGLSLLAQNSTVLVHECTNASLPGDKLDVEETKVRAQSRGHSTPQVAGAFAGRIRAQSLLLNHFSTRYGCPPADVMQSVYPDSNQPRAEPATSQSPKLATMQEISKQTTTAWHDAMEKDDGGGDEEGNLSAASPPSALTMATHRALLDLQLWRKRAAIPAWDGFEYHILRDDELLALNLSLRKRLADSS